MTLSGVDPRPHLLSAPRPRGRLSGPEPPSAHQAGVRHDSKHHRPGPPAPVSA